jgi:hypothetical protein
MLAKLDLDAAFRAARRRDWWLVAQCHLLALPISIVAFALICGAQKDPPLLLLPHYFYWTVAGALWSMTWPSAFLGVIGMLVFPIWIYRSVCYYRHAGTSPLLAAGLSGTWARSPSYTRALAAFEFGLLPTTWLVRRGATKRRLERIDPPLRRPNPALMRLLIALAISFHHLPLNYAMQVAFCVRAPWTLTLPNWLGPCKTSFGYEPGVRAFGCREPR